MMRPPSNNVVLATTFGVERLHIEPFFFLLETLVLTRDAEMVDSELPAEAFSTLERTLVVRSDAPDVLQYMRAAYKRLRTSPPDQRDQAYDEGVIFGVGTEQWLTFNRMPIDYREDVVNTNFRRAFYGSSKLFRLSFRRNPEWCSLYGAALCIGGRGVVLSAQSGIGKTTLALELMARGAGFYSDEFVFIRKSDGFVSGLPRALMIRERTCNVFRDERLRTACAAATPRSPHGDKVWDNIDPGAVFGEGVFAKPAPLAAAVVLERPSASKGSCERISAALAATEFTKRLNVDAEGFARLTTAARLLTAIPCYRIAARSLRDCADAIEALFS
ncbi:MAG TPA: hypothetical protein VKR99_01060 [Candidatus Eremiobacteraceae bacterium]|nr:hypothetical protein [Candidatus Eremiobacteraceae bacterium]